MDLRSSNHVVQGSAVLFYFCRSGAQARHFNLFPLLCFGPFSVSMCMELPHSLLMVPQLLQHGLCMGPDCLAIGMLLRGIEVTWPFTSRPCGPGESGSLFSSCSLLNSLAFSLLILAPSSFISRHIPSGCPLGFSGSVLSCGAPNAPAPWATLISVRLPDTYASGFSILAPASPCLSFFLICLGVVVWFEMDFSVCEVALALPTQTPSDLSERGSLRESRQHHGSHLKPSRL